MHDLHGGARMSTEDDAWALGRLTGHPSLEECTSARVTIDKVTHRVVLEWPNSRAWTGWRTLCESHRLMICDGRLVVVSPPPGSPRQAYDFSAASVDCLCCIPAGG